MGKRRVVERVELAGPAAAGTARVPGPRHGAILSFLLAVGALAAGCRVALGPPAGGVAGDAAAAPGDSAVPPDAPSAVDTGGVGADTAPTEADTSSRPPDVALHPDVPSHPDVGPTPADGALPPDALPCAPGPESCDGRDNDCDGETDEGVVATFYEDRDGDGYGDAGTPVQACGPPHGTVPVAGDCDDADPARFPGNPESCDGKDNDCDAETDEAAPCPEG